jgi:hypothetical protein
VLVYGDGGEKILAKARDSSPLRLVRRFALCPFYDGNNEIWGTARNEGAKNQMSDIGHA